MTQVTSFRLDSTRRVCHTASRHHRYYRKGSPLRTATIPANITRLAAILRAEQAGYITRNEARQQVAFLAIRAGRKEAR